MPGSFESVPPRERYMALAAAAVVQLGLILALVSGLNVTVGRMKDTAQQLIEIALPQPPPPPRPKVEELLPKTKPKSRTESAPKAAPAPLGGSPGTARAIQNPAVEAIVPIRPTAPAPGGGTGTGPAIGSGAGGGTGGTGAGLGGGGDGGGGTELEQIGGDIFPSDYPRRLGQAGIGGRVGVIFTVEVNGRASRCRIRRSSGIPELDQLTCRLIEQRFRFRPSMDRLGRPFAEEVEYDHEWTVNR